MDGGAVDEGSVLVFVKYILRETKSFLFALGLIMLVIGFPLIGGSVILTGLLLIGAIVLYFYAWAALSIFSDAPEESPATDDS